MTDKQIIIDGVDVSGCKKYEHEIVRCNATLKNMCFCGGRCTDKKNANCYFKQLKRKEQECEELKKNVAHWKMEHKEAKAKGEWTYDLVKKRLGQQLDQFKQTLTEIEEIAMCIMDDDLEESSAYYDAKQILQKISECEVKR